jgi:hypothetical protein
MNSDIINTFRQSYDETDIAALISQPRFLVAVDAASLGCCTLEQMAKLAFEGPPYVPYGLDPMAFARLVYEVIRRIQVGDIKVEPTLKTKYSKFYTKQSFDPN